MPVSFPRKNGVVAASLCRGVPPHCHRAPPRWNGRRGDSSTRWSCNCGTALQRDIFAAPNVTVVAGVSPAVRPLRRRHACHYRWRGVSDPGYNSIYTRSGSRHGGRSSATLIP
jgi:hypothetical protein